MKMIASVLTLELLESSGLAVTMELPRNYRYLNPPMLAPSKTNPEIDPSRFAAAGCLLGQ